MKIDKDTEQKIKRLQLFEQNLQTIAAQKQQFQSQLNEVEAAMKELNNVKSAYKIVGNIMVKSDKVSLNKELEQKKEMFSVRVKTLEKQENSVRDKSKELQKEVMGTIKDEEPKDKS
jgi:prefoldin beta subunit